MRAGLGMDSWVGREGGRGGGQQDRQCLFVKAAPTATHRPGVFFTSHFLLHLLAPVLLLQQLRLQLADDEGVKSTLVLHVGTARSQI